MRYALTAVAIAWNLLAVDPAAAQSASRKIDIAGGSLAAALEELGRETGTSLGGETAFPAIRVMPVRGTMSPQSALARLLAGSGFVARQVGPSAFRIERVAVPSPQPPSVVRHDAPPSPAPATLGPPIVVTATKREQRLADLPLAVAVVAFNPDSVRDALPDTASVQRQVEGLALGGQGPGRNRMFLRGVADGPFNGSTQSTVAVVLDGARVTWSAPEPDLRLIDVSRVEVIKGPQGALYGTGALGGIYHIVSNRPDPAAASARVEAGPDVFGSGEFGAHGTAIFNLPLVRDRAAVRIAVFGAKEPGWIETGTRGDSNGLRVGGIRASARLLVDRWTIDLAGQSQRLNSADSQYIYARDKRTRPAQIAEPHDNDFTHAAAEVSGPIGQIQLHLVSARTWHDVGDTFDATIGAASFGLADPARFIDDRTYRVWDNEARLSGHLGAASWVLGLGHIEARERVDQRLEAANPATSPLPIEQIARKATDTAVFGEATVPLGRGVSATVGGRLFHDSTSDRGIGANGASEREQRRTGFTPTVSVSWKSDALGLVYLRYGSAIRQRRLDIPATSASTNFEGDELRTVEVGLRRALPMRGSFDLSAYATDWKNLQTDTLQQNGLIAASIAGRARILGAEASFDAQLADGWRATLGAALQDARLVRNDLGIELDDRRLPVVPLYTLRARIEHGFAWRGDNRATIAAELHYDGPARLSFDPALDRPMGKALDARLGMRIALGHWAVGMQIDNLFDSRANLYAYGNPFRLLAARQFVPAAPTRASLTIGATF